ncbi:methyltransferase domain-containing protein [Candidatus Woesebacteria bacterium]|nr:methyltransferase domain-containing protein [Candidatus Woesebacteria bacterium]
MNLSDFLSGKNILEEVESPINGKLQVIRDLAWGTYIQGGGLTQSGGILEKIWKDTLKEIQDSRFKIQDVLILGLGAGSLAKLTRKNYPRAKITGVDIDPMMIDLGKKYLKLDDYKVEVQIEDAFEYLEKHQTLNTKHQTHQTKFDLVCVDLYVGEDFPEKFGSDEFIGNVKRILSKDGIAIFNRTYYDEKRTQAKKFGEKLEKHFKNVKWYYPEANLMFICRD